MKYPNPFATNEAVRRYSFVALLFSILSFTGCSEPSDEYADEEIEYSDETELTYDDNERYTPDPNFWREGTMEVELTVLQGALFEEEETYPDGLVKKRTAIQWSYELKARRKERVWLVNDLSVLMPNGSEEERFEFMESGPYFKNEDEQPEVAGSATFQLSFYNETPNGVDTKKIEKSLSGEAVIEHFTIDSLVPSLYGQGYQIGLELAFELKQRGYSSVMLRNGETTRSSEDADESIDYKVTVYPEPNEKQLNNYPYLYEYQSSGVQLDQSVLDAYTGLHMETLERLQKIAKNQVDFFHQELVGMVSKRTKDALTINYTLENNKLLPLIPKTEMLAATPDKTLFELKVKLHAL